MGAYRVRLAYAAGGRAPGPDKSAGHGHHHGQSAGGEPAAAHLMVFVSDAAPASRCRTCP